LFLGLRRRDGIDRNEFQRLSGFNLDELAKEAISVNVGRGWLENITSGIRLTREGQFVADRVIADFL
jgi:coproporphyrinogen III oxidase-like Fe-S oxidoreductase